MASRIRVVAKVAGAYCAGSTVRARFELYGQPTKTLDDLIKNAKTLGVPLWIFREPRGVKASKSRYKRICRELGIRNKKKSVFNVGDLFAAPANVAGGQHGGANQPQGFAAGGVQAVPGQGPGPGIVWGAPDVQ